jgi:hypothetical protein
LIAGLDNCNFDNFRINGYTISGVEGDIIYTGLGEIRSPVKVRSTIAVVGEGSSGW